jgi:hypothetical protein
MLSIVVLCAQVRAENVEVLDGVRDLALLVSARLPPERIAKLARGLLKDAIDESGRHAVHFFVCRPPLRRGLRLVLRAGGGRRGRVCRAAPGGAGLELATPEDEAVRPSVAGGIRARRGVGDSARNLLRVCDLQLARRLQLQSGHNFCLFPSIFVRLVSHQADKNGGEGVGSSCKPAYTTSIHGSPRRQHMGRYGDCKPNTHI